MSRRAVEYACSFCHEPGHYWPTCRKKARTDDLMRRMVEAIIAEEVRRALVKAFPDAAPLLLRVGRVTLKAYNHAGGRWNAPRRRLALPGRRGRAS